MNLRMFLATATLMVGFAASAQQDSTMGNNGMGNSKMSSNGKIGKMTVAAFNSVNAKGNQAVSAITPTKSPMSAADKALFMKVAAGGQRQLAISQAVLAANVTNDQVKILANSEVEEQTGIAAKMKEIAGAKGVMLPDGPDAAAQASASKVQGLTGADLDNFYITESGINGHVLLQKTMTTVNATAKDATLKSLATATLPVIKTHLTVSRDVKTMMSGTKANASMK